MLSKKALEAINNRSTRIKLAIALGKTEATIIRLIYTNHSNLTKAAALAVIRGETGLTDDEILEPLINISIW